MPDEATLIAKQLRAYFENPAPLEISYSVTHIKSKEAQLESVYKYELIKKRLADGEMDEIINENNERCPDQAEKNTPESIQDFADTLMHEAQSDRIQIAHYHVIDTGAAFELIEWHECRASLEDPAAGKSEVVRYLNDGKKLVAIYDESKVILIEAARDRLGDMCVLWSECLRNVNGKKLDDLLVEGEPAVISRESDRIILSFRGDFRQSEVKGKMITGRQVFEVSLRQEDFLPVEILQISELNGMRLVTFDKQIEYRQTGSRLIPEKIIEIHNRVDRKSFKAVIGKYRRIFQLKGVSNEPKPADVETLLQNLPRGFKIHDELTGKSFGTPG